MRPQPDVGLSPTPVVAKGSGSAWNVMPKSGSGKPDVKKQPDTFEPKELRETPSSEPPEMSAGKVGAGQPVPSRVRTTPITPTPGSEGPAATRRASRSNLILELPGKTDSRGVSDTELVALLSTAEYSNMATDWRKAAERAVEVEAFAEASRAFKNEAAIYRQSGDAQAAIAEETRASYYSTELQMFRTVPFKGQRGLERLEPANGCYVGAFIDRDDSLKKLNMQSQVHGDIPQFNELVKTAHASFFMYRSYGMPFPEQWAEYVKEQGAIPHIAWEPRDLNDVRDDDYLRDFMSSAADLDHPVVLRFAGEMNGTWTPYNGNPEAYVEAFRTVYKASRGAPKVAMLWCPNTVPQSGIEEYYPGHDYVDWVGVNFYSVPYLDNEIDRPGDKIFPAEQFKFVYEKYSAHKPIAIGEWAASQKSVLEERDRTDFAVTKLAQLYSVLPTQYPRVKMVNWYDCNNIARAKKERQLNNFQITNSEEILDAYQRAVAHPHFLGAGLENAEQSYEPVKDKVKLVENDELRLALKSYDPTLKVYFKAGGKVVHASSDPLEWYVTSEQLPGKSGQLKVLVFDSRDRFVTRGSVGYLVE
jgi:hypothetical protein